MQEHEPSNKKGGGRPCGTRDTLHRGEVAAAIALRHAVAEHGEAHPIVRECLGTFTALTSDVRGRRGRLVAYRAMVLLLERLPKTSAVKPAAKRFRPRNTEGSAVADAPLSYCYTVASHRMGG